MDTSDTILSIRKERPLKYRQNDYVVIEVSDPITHNTWENGRYSTYQFKLQTNSIVFTLAESCVRRRYSHFVWLQRQLKRNHESITPPPLPPKTFFRSRFSKDVINNRILGLAEFLMNVFEETLYLSDSLLHLFLQTNLDPEEMLACTVSGSGVNVSDVIVKEEREKVSICHSSCMSDIGLLSLPPAVREAALAQSPHTLSSTGQLKGNFSKNLPQEGSTGLRCHTNRLSIPIVCVTDVSSSLSSQSSEFLECELKLGQSTSTPVVGILKLKRPDSLSCDKKHESSIDVCDADSGCSMDGDITDSGETESLESSLKLARKRRVTFSSEVIVSPIERVL